MTKDRVTMLTIAITILLAIMLMIVLVLNAEQYTQEDCVANNYKQALGLTIRPNGYYTLNGKEGRLTAEQYNSICRGEGVLQYLTIK